MVTISDSDYDELSKIWDFKNNTTPFERTKLKSTIKYYWKCNLGHSYSLNISSIIRKGRDIKSCPVCTGKIIVKGVNDLTTTNPDVLNQWCYDKNDKLPEKHTRGMHKKVWWKCPNFDDHVFLMSISNKIKRNSQCPYCSGKILLKGFNDLETKNPQLASEISKNSEIKADEIMPCSTKKVLWKCDKNHEWESTVGNRTAGKSCPYCNGVKLLAGFNDLQTKFPQITAEWDYNKNSLTPSQVFPGSNKKAWWKCSVGHSYSSVISSKIKLKNGCPYCSNQKVLEGFNDLATTNPELAKQVNVEKSDFTPLQIVEGSNKIVWWKCEENHEWKAKVSDRKKYGCPYCSNQRLLIGFNDFASNNPQLLKEWDYDKNTVSPENLFKKSYHKIWWKCEKGHSYEMRSSDRIRGYNCHYCSGRYPIKGETDLFTTHPDLCKEWNYKKNEQSPEIYSFGSHKKVWWICEKGHEWEAIINNRARHDHRCPRCSSTGISKLETQLFEYVQQLFTNELVISNSRQIIKPYELDIYIPHLNKAIEFNGSYWHSDEMIKKHKGMSAEDYHQMKLNLCKDKGIELVFVWEYDWENNSEIVQENLRKFLLNNYVDEILSKKKFDVNNIM